MGKRDNWRISYIIAIIIVVLLIALFCVRTIRHYSEFKTHKDYFRQSNQKIEEWMPLGLVLNKFDIPTEALFQKLGIKDTISNRKLAINQICKKNNLNCTEVLNELNLLEY